MTVSRVMTFQFHKVQLKAMGKKIQRRMSMFQFHKVQLKVACIAQYINE